MQNGSNFHTTRWTVVLAAGSDAPEARAALDELCAAYWYPLYAFLRRDGHADEEALDLVQDFVAALLEGRSIDGADPERGRFRAYLIGALRHHTQNSRRAASAVKRDGGQVTSLDLTRPHHEAARRYDPSAANEDRSPEQEFERAWALELIARATLRLREEYESRGRAEVFGALEETLDGGEGDRSHAERADELGCSVGAVKVAAHRLRQRLGELIRDEISQTVAGADGIDAELQALCAALGSEIG